jgi:hypothetical protein
LGFSIGYKKTNNYSNLDELELTETHVFVDTSSGITRTYESKVTGKTGEYKVYNRLDFQQDIFWIAAPRLGIYQYSRFKKPDNADLNITAGAGAYLLTDDAFTSRAGIVFEFSDLTNISTTPADHLSVSLVVGFSFGE